MSGKPKKYWVVDQVQKSLWYQIGRFSSKAEAEKFRSALSGKTQSKFTYPAAHNYPAILRRPYEDTYGRDPASTRGGLTCKCCGVFKEDCHAKPAKRMRRAALAGPPYGKGVVKISGTQSTSTGKVDWIARAYDLREQVDYAASPNYFELLDWAKNKYPHAHLEVKTPKSAYDPWTRDPAFGGEKPSRGRDYRAPKITGSGGPPHRPGDALRPGLGSHVYRLNLQPLENEPHEHVELYRTSDPLALSWNGGYIVIAYRYGRELTRFIPTRLMLKRLMNEVPGKISITKEMIDRARLIASSAGR